MSKTWMPLDNAALIFPAIRRRRWINVFRVSATLTEDIDTALLQQAVDTLKPRFPSLYVRLRAGAFWYYLEEVEQPPRVGRDYAYPVTHMGRKELRTCSFRVLCHGRRLAVEFFHSLTDGSGAMIYLRTLTACYLHLRYGAAIPAEKGVLDWEQPPRPEELEDSFQRCTAEYAVSRAEPDSWRLKGTREDSPFLHLTTGVIPSAALVDAAHRQGVTVTALLAAVMLQCILELQAERLPRRRRKPVKVSIPVNLRGLFPSETLRNFALTVNVGVDPRLGEYSLEDLCRAVSSQLAAEVTPQKMAGRIAANVNSQRMPLLKIAPLFMKNAAMRMVYDSVGERKNCLNISNLGNVPVPEAMAPYLERIEFIIGVQYTYPNNCSVASCGGVTCINMIRNIRESRLEQKFFSRLVELGVPVEIESNEKG